jgi:hypothetical protein
MSREPSNKWVDAAVVLGSIALAIVGFAQARYGAAVVFAVLPVYLVLLRRWRARSSLDNASAGTALQRVWKSSPSWGFLAGSAALGAWRGIEEAHKSNVPGAALAFFVCVGAVDFAILVIVLVAKGKLPLP